MLRSFGVGAGLVLGSLSVGAGVGCAGATTGSDPVVPEVRPAAPLTPEGSHLRLTELLDAGHEARQADNWGLAVKQYEAVLEEHGRVQYATPESASVAAEAQFWLAEYQLAKLDDHQLTGQGSELADQTKALFDSAVGVSKAYYSVRSHAVAEWTVAANTRKAFAYEVVARKLREAAVPESLQRDSIEYEAYWDVVEQSARKFDSQALDLYGEALGRANQARIENEWTQLAYARAASLRTRLGPEG